MSWITEGLRALCSQAFCWFIPLKIDIVNRPLVVANNAVLAVIGAERGSPLLISPGGASRVAAALSGLPEERLSALVNEVAIQVSRGLPPSVVRYLQRYLSREMLPRLSGVLRDGGIERFVIEQE